MAGIVLSPRLMSSTRARVLTIVLSGVGIEGRSPQ